MKRITTIDLATFKDLNQRFSFVLIFIMVVAIFYFSWLPDPTFKTEIYMPSWIQNWSTMHYNLRTAIPFIFLAFLLEFKFLLKYKQMTLPLRIQISFTTVSSCAFIVCVAEIGQYFTVSRNPDSMDVMYGLLGSILGIVLYYLGSFLLKLFYKENA